MDGKYFYDVRTRENLWFGNDFLLFYRMVVRFWIECGNRCDGNVCSFKIGQKFVKYGAVSLVLYWYFDDVVVVLRDAII